MYQMASLRRMSICHSLDNKITYTVFYLITAPALITAPSDFLLYFTNYRTLDDVFLTFYFIFSYYRPLDDLLALVVKNKFT